MTKITWVIANFVKQGLLDLTNPHITDWIPWSWDLRMHDIFFGQNSNILWLLLRHWYKDIWWWYYYRFSMMHMWTFHRQELDISVSIPGHLLTLSDILNEYKQFQPLFMQWLVSHENKEHYSAYQQDYRIMLNKCSCINKRSAPPALSDNPH